MLNTIPYLLPFTLPLLSLTGIRAGGFWVLAGFAIAYVLHPILDLLFGEDLTPEPATGLTEKIHSFLLWLYLPLQTYVLYSVLKICSTGVYNSWELAGIIFTTGTITGGMGITVAHELVHRRERWERGIGVVLLLMVNYAHFRVEHVFGHHKHVSTPIDPATARPGESLYRFLFRSVIFSWLSAWRMESKKKKSLLHHRLVHYILAQLILALSVAYFLGATALMVYLGQSVVAFLTLEVINYIEHYGLVRKEISPGVYEPVTELHSWDSPSSYDELVSF